MAIGDVDVGQELLNVPMGDMIRSMALAIAEGQWELDKSSMTVTELMSGQRLLRDLDSGELLSKNGVPLNDQSDEEPEIIDSRVYFGYEYDYQYDLEYQDSADGKVRLKNKGQDLTATDVTALKGKVTQNKEKIKSTDVVASEALSTAELREIEGKFAPRRVAQKVSMIELGFVPTFYQFVDTIIDVRISIAIHGSTTDTKTNTSGTSKSQSSASQSHQNNGYWWRYNRRVGASQSRNQTVSTSQVNATYSAKYSYDVTGSSTLRTKLVPVPPPAVLEERIRALMDIEREYLARGGKSNEPT